MKTTRRPGRLAAAVRGGAWGALGGAGFGASLALAETLVGLVSGGERALDWWALLTLYYATATALLGGGVGLARSLVRPERDCGSTDLWLLASGYFFFHTTVLLLQQCFPLRPLLSTERVVATALSASLAALAWWLARDTGGPPTRGEWSLLAVGGLLIPVCLVASYALALQALDGRVGVGLSLLVLPFTVFVLAARLLSRWPRTWPGGALLGLVLLLGSLVYATRPPGPDESVFLSDSAQPVPKGDTHGAPRPNIVLIVLDTLRARNVSSYGYARQTTPHIDAFARESVLYSSVLVPGTWSLPSHASLFTGLYPSRHGAHRPAAPEPGAPPPPSVLAPERHTLAEILSDEGYATAIVSANFAVLSRFLGLQQGFRYAEARPAARVGYRPLLLRVRDRLPAWRVLRPALEWLATPYRPAEEITDSSLAWIRSGPRPGQPYFLCVNYMDAHEPHVPRGRFGDLFAAEPRTRPPGGHGPSVLAHGVVTGQRTASPGEVRRLVTLYDAAVAYMDSHVGRLLDVLRARPDYGNTWVFITSDHGEALGEHQSLGHGQSLYQEILHVPLLVRYPDGWGARPGSRDASPAQSVDVVPTILQALGIAAPAPLDGVPLGGGREVMLAEDFPLSWPVRQQNRRHGPGSRALVVDGLKYLRHDDGFEELYDLDRDPLEERNLAEAMPEAVARLRARLEAWSAAAAEEGPPPAPRVSLPPAVEEDLRALGYVE